MTLIKIAAGIALAVSVFAWHVYDRTTAYSDGQRAERVVWQEAKAAAEAKAELDRKDAQDRINAAERSYLLTRAAADVQRAELNKALENEKAAARACTAVTRELRDRLAKIGTHP